MFIFRCAWDDKPFAFAAVLLAVPGRTGTLIGAGGIIR